ncbi:hypothetical protein ARMGADRAFT_1038934 [Armillaria gallica]|uniref:DUF659 domain-containing protein n=1 Tax=Armillaria gallica TaxID=47427 RepID=A0A2H3CG57_ARMGA|nr:hypothetical protein ARMGADRAFT_1038934 [Armillaria gallica]
MNPATQPAPVNLPSFKAEGPQEWYREHFFDHPLYQVKTASPSGDQIRDPSSMHNGKAKVVCCLCLQQHIMAARASDQELLNLGGIQEAREDSAIIDQSLAAMAPTPGPSYFPGAFGTDSPELMMPWDSRAASPSLSAIDPSDSISSIAFTATVKGKVRTIRVYDASKERKTADNLLKLMKEVIEILEQKWRVKVIVFVSDASDCYAHQINLIVRDYFKAEGGFLIHEKNVTELITWLHSKTFILALLCEAQPLMLLIANENMAAATGQEQKLVTGDAKSQQKAQDMLLIMQDPGFWHALARIKNHLELLAIAANVTQAALCHLDQVLLTFGQLYMHYTTALTEPEDAAVKQVILNSLDRHWENSEQEVFIAALLKEVKDYLGGIGSFASLDIMAETIAMTAMQKGESPNPLKVYEGQFLISIDNLGTPLPPLIRLTWHILSVTANSASCEHFFNEHLEHGRARPKRYFGLKHDQADAVHYQTNPLMVHATSQPDQSANSDITEAAESSGANEPLPASHSERFSDLAAELQRRVSEDDIDEWDLDSEVSEAQAYQHASSAPKLNPILLDSLFNFQSQEWIAVHQCSATKNLQDELELYKLVDLDAEGDGDKFSIEIDTTMGSIM